MAKKILALFVLVVMIPFTSEAAVSKNEVDLDNIKTIYLHQEYAVKTSGQVITDKHIQKIKGYFEKKNIKVMTVEDLIPEVATYLVNQTPSVNLYEVYKKDPQKAMLLIDFYSLNFTDAKVSLIVKQGEMTGTQQVAATQYTTYSPQDSYYSGYVGNTYYSGTTTKSVAQTHHVPGYERPVFKVVCALVIEAYNPSRTEFKTQFYAEEQAGGGKKFEKLADSVMKSLMEDLDQLR